MSAAALPYTVLILFVELAAGSILVVTVFDARALVTRGYVQTGALIVVSAALLAVVTLRALDVGEAVDGYALQRDWLPAFEWSLRALLALAVLYLVAAFRGWRRPTLALGVLGSAAGLAALVALSGLIAAPTWSYAGTLGGMLASALVLGGSLMAMTWGHWYLTNSGLPKEPMEQLSLLVLGALLVQALFVLLGAVLPVRVAPPHEAAFGVSLGQNPAFWLRVLVGIAFPLVLATLAWRAAAIRGMMSATGLLYIAVGAVLTGEALARGLLFATGAAV